LLASALFVRRTRLWYKATAVAAAIMLLPASPLLQARSRRALSDLSGAETWRRVNVTILARGSHVSGSTGNMDSYLVLLLEGKNSEPVAARLVHYYPGFQTAITDDAISSHPQFRLSVTAANYCAMDAKAFVVIHAFDSEAIEKVQGHLPCMVVR
jgi:hypothetical protein